MKWMKLLPVLILLSSLVLQGCGGGSSSGDSGAGGSTTPQTSDDPPQTSDDAPQIPDEVPRGPFTISGKVTYQRVFFNDTGSGLDYATRQNLPAREIIVDLVDAADNAVARSQTDALGNYSFTLADQGSYRVVASARLANTDTRVTDNTDGNSLYQLRGSLANAGPGGSVRNLNASIGWGTSAFLTDRAAAPFAILDTVYEGIRRLEEEAGDIFTTADLPATELRWSVNNRPTEGGRTTEDLEAGDIGSSFYTTELGVIYLLGAASNDTDEFDQHVILHEWTHYLTDALSRSDSIGGSHSLNDKLDLRLAWGEGIATAFAAIFLEDPEYRDSSGSNQGSEFFFSVESPAVSSIGWYSESTVMSLIYDLYDINADSADNISMGFSPIWRALTEEDFLQQDSAVSIYSALNGIDPGTSEAAFLNLVSASQIAGEGDWGEDETNDGGIDEALPVYTEIPIGLTETVCVDNALGFPNKLGNRRLIRLDNPTGERISITADSLVAQETDPDMALYRQGQCQALATSGVNGSETLVTELSGSLVLDLQDWWKLHPDLTSVPVPDQPEPSCFAVTVELAPSGILSDDCELGVSSTKAVESRISKPGASVDMQVYGNGDLAAGVGGEIEVVLAHQYQSGLATITFDAPSGVQVTPQSVEVDLSEGYRLPLVVEVLAAEAGRHYLSVDVLVRSAGISERRALAIALDVSGDAGAEQKLNGTGRQNSQSGTVHLLIADEVLIN